MNEDGNKPTLVQTVAAMVAGIAATKIAAYAVTTAWRLVTREDPPQLDEPERPGKKAAWVGLFSAATGTARQMARDVILPRERN